MNNIPKLRFAEFKDDISNKSLGRFLTHIGTGVTPRGGNSVYQKDGIMLIRSQNVYDSSLKLDDVAYISEEINSRMKKSKVYSGDVLLNITGASIGRSALVPSNFPRANVNQHVCILRVNEELNPNFLKNFIESSLGQKRIFQDQAGQTREALNLTQIKAFKIGVPSIKEQKKIGLFLSKINTKFHKQQEKVELVKKEKKGLMQKIFNKELQFKNEKSGSFSKWKDKKISELLYIPSKIKEENPKRNKLLTVKLNLNGVENNKNVKTLKIGSTNYYKRSAGQFIYGKQNLFNGAFGIVPDQLDGYLSSADIPVLGFYYDVINPYYFLYYLSQRDVYKKLENISTGTGSKRIHERELLKQEIELPCLKEQEKIVEILSIMTKKIEKETHKLTILQEQKKGFMQKMFI